MIVCDRHPRTKATCKIDLPSTEEHFDLCDQCFYQIKEFIGNATLETVEQKPKKNTAKAA